MRTLGRLSEGIRIGLTTGFDSGSSLDYVYRNQARGALLIGKLIDRGYLEFDRLARHSRAPTASAARDCQGRSDLRAAGQPLRRRYRRRPGRYVLDAVANCPSGRVDRAARLQRIECRSGRALIADEATRRHRALRSRRRFRRSRSGALTPRPNLVDRFRPL
jgi:hypothetical protein